MLDVDTGAVIVAEQQPAGVSSGGVSPRVVVLGDSFLLCWVNTLGVLVFVRIGIDTPATPAAPVDLAGGFPTGDRVYDVVTHEGLAFAVYFTDALKMRAIGADYAPGSEVTVSADTAVAVACVPCAAGLLIAWATSAKVRIAVRDAILFTVIPPLDADTVGSIRNIAGITHSGGIELLYSQDSLTAPSDTSRRRVYAQTLVDYAPGARRDFLRSVGLVGKPFVQGSTVYVPVAHQSRSDATAQQNTLFLADLSGRIVAKAFPGVHAGHPVGSGLPNSARSSTGRWQIAAIISDLITARSGKVLTSTGAATVGLDFVAVDTYQTVELAGALHVSGGILQMYDGQSVAEHGFHLYPEGLSVPSTSGALSHQYVACYAWTDHRGQVHRSAPSPAVTCARADPIAVGDTVTVQVPSLRLTGKSGVIVEIYRTLANGSEFYLVTSALVPLANSTTADTVTLSDGMTDEILHGSPTLYTAGAAIENTAAPAAGAMAVHRSRIFLVDAAEPTRLWYSRQWAPGAPVEFSDLFQQPVDPRGGPITALASLDDKLIVFKRDRIFFLTGQGPDATGAQNDFLDPQLVTTADAGCINPRSVVGIPSGLMFQSVKGIYLLDRALSATYIGADVEAHNAARITAAAIAPDASRVLFTLESGAALVFDYLVGQWGLFTGLSAAGAAVHRGRVTLLRGTGVVWRESATPLDDTAPVPLRIATPWLRLSEIGGFQRVSRLAVLGDCEGTHRLKISVAIDYDSTPVQVETVEGSGQMQWRMHLARQKCQAVQVTVEDLEADNTGLSISALSFEVGVKRGLAKLAAGRSR
jgi:hypothetical protein